MIDLTNRGQEYFSTLCTHVAANAETCKFLNNPRSERETKIVHIKEGRRREREKERKKNARKRVNISFSCVQVVFSRLYSDNPM